MKQSETFLVAFEMAGDPNLTRAEQEKILLSLLPAPGGYIECWWVAEDVRHDGSDNDSAVFVKPGSAFMAWGILSRRGLTGAHNKPVTEGTPWEES